MSVGEPAKSPSQDVGTENKDSQVQALMEPAALEMRLAEARARRERVLDHRARKARAERPARPFDLPPEATRPLVDDDAPLVAGDTADRPTSRAEVGGACERRSPLPMPNDAVSDAPERILTLVHPQQRPLQRVGGEAGAIQVAEEVAAEATEPVDKPRRRVGAPLLALGALVVGAAMGLAAAALVPGLGGWQIVIVRSAEEGQADPSVAALEAGGDTVVRDSDVPGAGKEERDVAPAPVDVPFAFSRIAELGAATAPGGFALPPDYADNRPDPIMETAPLELPVPVERAAASLPRIEPPGIAPQGDMTAPSAIGVAALPAAWAPARMVTDAAPEPPWQPPAMDAPEMTEDREAMASFAPAPSAPPASNLLSSTTRGASIVLHHPPDAAEAAAAARETLVAAGAEQVAVREVGFSISSPNVRYYHGEDRQAAADISDLLAAASSGAEVEARDFTDYEPEPDPGLIEVWIAGSAPVVERARPVRSDPAEAARERLTRSIEARLRDRLQ